MAQEQAAKIKAQILAIVNSAKNITIEYEPGEIPLFRAEYDCIGVYEDGTAGAFHNTEYFYADGERVRKHDPMDDFGGCDLHRGY